MDTQNIVNFVKHGVGTHGFAVVACTEICDCDAEAIAKRFECQLDKIKLPIGPCYRYLKKEPTP